MAEREVSFTIATGLKGVGKSYSTFFKVLLPYSLGLLNNGVARKVLIIDVNDEYGVMKPSPHDEYAMALTKGKTIVVNPLEPKDIKLFTWQRNIEIRRIRPYHYRNYYDEKNKLQRRAGEAMGEKELLKLVTKCLSDFRGGMLLIEDLATTVGTHVPGKIFSEITRNRHRDNDIITHIQSIGAILPKFWQNINYCRFHKQLDDVDRSEEKLQGLYALYKISQIMVDYQYERGNNRYFLYCDNMNRKIRGDYGKEQLMDAIYRYIDYSGNILRPLLYQRTETGHKVRNYSEAREEKALELYREYSALRD